MEDEEFKSPAKPEDPLNLSFFSSKKGRSKIIKQALEDTETKVKNYESDCHSIAEKQRRTLEDYVNQRKPIELTQLISDLVSSSQSISEIRKYINKLLDSNGKVHGLIKEKEKDIVWPKMFLFTKNNFKSNHPNWLIFSVLGGLFIIPEVIDYLLYFPIQYLIKWNILFALIWGGYIIFSIIKIRKLRKDFHNYFVKNLHNIDDYFRNSFKSFKKFLETHIIRIFLRKISSADEILLNNQAFLFSYYLTNFKSSSNYEKLKLSILNQDDLTTYNLKLFNNQLNKELLNALSQKEYLKEVLIKIRETKELIKIRSQLINLIENEYYTTRLSALKEKLNSSTDGDNVYEIIKNQVDKSKFNFDNNKFLQKINTAQLESDINDFITLQSFDNLLVEIKNKISFKPKEIIDDLISKDHHIYYLTQSPNKIDEKRIIFTPDKIVHDEKVLSYTNYLKVICGYLK